jgi:hypothetical protein
MASLVAQYTMEIMAGVAAKPCQKDGKRFANLCSNALTNNTLQKGR